MNRKELNSILENHEKWVEGEEGGVRANLSGANLRGTNLSGANLIGANLDYSCLPLWCGSLGANFDDRQLVQIAYHLVRAGLNSNNASEETKKELSKLIDFANKFHRVKECGMIKMTSEDANDR